MSNITGRIDLNEDILKNGSLHTDICPVLAEDTTVINETTSNQLIFNVMPNMRVEENLYIKEYRVDDNYIEAVYSRKYKSSMAKSPSHLIFLSVLVHMQKMLYVYMCQKLDLKYDPYAPEVLKVWPTTLSINMPKLVTKCEDIVHRMDIISVKKVRDKVYHVTAETNVEGIISIDGTAMIYIL